MPDAPQRLFTVACSNCQRLLMIVDRIRDQDIAALRAHVRVCCPYVSVEDTGILGQLLRHVRVAIAEQE